MYRLDYAISDITNVDITATRDISVCEISRDL